MIGQGQRDYNAFYYDSGEPSGSITKYGWAHIFVLKPDEDMANVLKSATRLLINPKES